MNMLVLGLHFGALVRDERRSCLQTNDVDGGAAIVAGGRVVAAAAGAAFVHGAGGDVGLPFDAAARCLDAARMNWSDLDGVAVDFTEAALDTALLERALRDPRAPARGVRAWICDLVQRRFDVDVAQRLHFVDHRHAQMHAAWLDSRFDRALCLVLDEEAGGQAVAAAVCDAAMLQALPALAVQSSLAELAWFADDLLDLQGDEALRPGDLGAVSPGGSCDLLFQRACLAERDGGLRIAGALDRLEVLRQFASGSRRPLTRDPRRLRAELGASLREALVGATRHVLHHLAGQVHSRQLCLAGSIGIDPTLTGAILQREHRFDRVFASGRSVGAGVAVGAAALVARAHGDAPMAGVRAAAATRADAAPEVIARWLRAWGPLLAVTPAPALPRAAAASLARGARVAWGTAGATVVAGQSTRCCWLASPAACGSMAVADGSTLLVAEESLGTFFEIPANVVACAQVRIRLGVRAGAHRWLVDAAPEGTLVVEAVSAARDVALHDLLLRVGELTGAAMLLATEPPPGCATSAQGRLDDLASAVLAGLIDEAFVAGWQLGREAVLCLPDLARHLTPGLGRGRRLCRRAPLNQPGSCTLETTDPLTGAVAARLISAAAFRLLSTTQDSEALQAAHDRIHASSGPLQPWLLDEFLALWREGELSMRPAAA